MGAERAESRRHLELDSTMSSSKKIYSMHPNVVAGEHGQHHARIADSYRLSILLTHMSYRACVLCRVRRRRTRRVRRRGPAPRDDARIGAVWPPGYGVRLVSDTAAVLRTGDCCSAATARPWPVPVRPGWLAWSCRGSVAPCGGGGASSRSHLARSGFAIVAPRENRRL